MITERRIAQIIRNRTAQGFSPRAIAYQIEKEMSMVQTNLCHDCHQEMEALEQEQRQAPPLTIVTCKNRSCALWSVTLSTAQYAKLTNAEWQDYRESVARLKKTLRMEE